MPTGLLQTAIESNMKIGDKLPGEVELADRFHVSRVSIREAINGLKFLGMLDAAPRRGTTIAALDYRRLVKYLGFQMAFSSLSEEELFDARLALEIGMLDLVGQRMTDEDYRELLELADACRRESDEPKAVADSIEADMRFHQRLLEISGNSMLQAFVKLIESFFHRQNAHPGNRAGPGQRGRGSPHDRRSAARSQHRAGARPDAEASRPAPEGLIPGFFS